MRCAVWMSGSSLVLFSVQALLPYVLESIRQAASRSPRRGRNRFQQWKASCFPERRDSMSWRNQSGMDRFLASEAWCCPLGLAHKVASQMKHQGCSQTLACSACHPGKRSPNNFSSTASETRLHQPMAIIFAAFSFPSSRHSSRASKIKLSFS